MQIHSLRPTEHVTTWGLWQLKPATFVLWHPNYPNYEFDLELMTGPAKLLDWIMQFAGKPWFTPEDLGYLLYAIDDVLQPQAHFCSFGQVKAGDPVRIARSRGYAVLQEVE